MYPRYKCLVCGWCRRRRKIIVVCPICGSKPVKMKDGVDVKKIIKIIKGR
ncbi:hypothetical protein ES708_15491 [subsurface metagenome]